MAWSTPRTWAVGEVVTSGNMNLYVSNDLAYLHGDAGVITLVNVVNATGFQVSGVALAATHLSNGVTGSGTVVLATSATITSPTISNASLTGTPTAPTQAANDNSTKVATTAYVDSAVTGGTTTAAPTGTIVAFGGMTAPGGWLLLDGSAVSRTTYATLMNAITFTQGGTLTVGSAIVTGLTSTANMWVGMKLEGTNIPTNTTILSIDSATQIHMSANASGSGTPTIRFFPFGNGDGSTTFNVPDGKGRMLTGVALSGGHADVSGLGLNDGSALASRRPKHAHGLGTIAISASGAHGHTFTGTAGNTGIESVGHTHTYSGTTSTESATHTHSGTTGTESVGHTHNSVIAPDITGSFSSGGGSGWNGGTSGSTATTGESATHTHSFTSGGQSVNHTHTYSGTTSGISADHTHSFTPAGNLSATDTHTHSTGNFTGSVGTTTSAPTESAAYLVVNYIIKT